MGCHFLLQICIKAELKAAQQKVISYALVSAITQEPNENPTDFLERLSSRGWGWGGAPKVHQSGLRFLRGKVMVKDKFLSQCASDLRIKLQQLWQQNPAASLDEMVQTATNTFYTEQEREAKAQEREKRKETRHDEMLPALQGSPVANPESLKDKAQAKCLICRQVGHWTKECPNHDKSKTACYKCHQLGH